MWQVSFDKNFGPYGSLTYYVTQNGEIEELLHFSLNFFILRTCFLQGAEIKILRVWFE